MKAETQEIPVPTTSTGSDDLSKLLQQYGCGPIPLLGTDNGFYERHLVFDNVVELMAAGPRERFEAFARSCFIDLSATIALDPRLRGHEGLSLRLRRGILTITERDMKK